jgi:predicted pyridoxine 5'-phosphate oxidase superfamily flavin-nucleotide-binding protein
MPDQHRDFFAMLPFIVVGTVDGANQPRASILTGRPGFITSPDPRTLRIAARFDDRDPAAGSLVAGARIGLLGIQPETRRRNRMNGRVTEIARDGFEVSVDQSFGNCPQYIPARAPRFPAERPPAEPARFEAAQLSPPAARLIASADTFFIATAAPAAGDAAIAGADISHRGGRPGFVKVAVDDGATVLTAPDFRGNNAFNTFGNIALNPLAGLLFVDFARGDLLSLTGTAEVVWDGAELAAFAGAQRLLRFRVDQGVWLPRALPFRWSAAEAAPQIAATGHWAQPAKA